MQVGPSPDTLVNNFTLSDVVINENKLIVELSTFVCENVKFVINTTATSTDMNFLIFLNFCYVLQIAANISTGATELRLFSLYIECNYPNS